MEKIVMAAIFSRAMKQRPNDLLPQNNGEAFEVITLSPLSRFGSVSPEYIRLPDQHKGAISGRSPLPWMGPTYGFGNGNKLILLLGVTRIVGQPHSVGEKNF